jgi:parvulin-like peptidyl-prolyl isomerase
VSAERRATLLLALGTAGGIALAAFGIVRSGSHTGSDADTDGAVALVNGEPISSESFERLAESVAAERQQTELDTATRNELLQHMIDQELLFQRGLDLGLARHEPSARNAIVAAMTASIAVGTDLSEPDEAELRRYYEENAKRFARPDRLDLEVGFVRSADESDDGDDVAYRRAEEIARLARAGEPLARLREELADPPAAPLPEGALPLETLREHLGPTVVRHAMALEPGALSDPVRGGDGYYVLRLRERAPGEVLPFEEVRTRVRSETLRTRGERTLRAYVEDLRASGDVRVLDPELADGK